VVLLNGWFLLRIISGKWKGRKLKGFDIDGTRPTMDRVKESLFGMIQNYVPNSFVLDLFAGSGALGLEALSNGAANVILCDNNDISIRTILENSRGMENAKVIQTDYKKFLKETDLKFDIIFLDPPYRANILNKAIRIIEEREILNIGGIVVCEFEGMCECSYELIKIKKYGSKFIHVYKRKY